MIEALKEVVGPLDKIPFKRMESRQSERGESDFEGAVSDTPTTPGGARMRSMSLASSHVSYLSCALHCYSLLSILILFIFSLVAFRDDEEVKHLQSKID